MTTVGFGDIYPLTWIGKLLCMFTALMGTFVISLTIVSLKQAVRLDQGEQKGFHILLEQQTAARTIARALEFRVWAIRKFWEDLAYESPNIKRFKKTLDTEKNIEVIS